MQVIVQHTTAEEKLIYLLEKLVEVVRYDNGYSWVLLRSVTVNKSAVIALDGTAVFLKATEDNGYTLHSRVAQATEPLNFGAKAETLRRILAGLTTIDKAIAENEFFIRSTFEDALNVYKLALTLLSEAAVNPNLRMLWEEFLEIWEGNKRLLGLSSFEQQQPRYDSYVAAIPETVLNIGLNVKVP